MTIWIFFLEKNCLPKWSILTKIAAETTHEKIFTAEIAHFKKSDMWPRLSIFGGREWPFEIFFFEKKLPAEMVHLKKTAAETDHEKIFTAEIAHFWKSDVWPKLIMKKMFTAEIAHF